MSPETGIRLANSYRDARIQAITRLVEEACRKDTNYFGYGIWEHHVVHVVAYARLMAEKTGADVEVAEIAALLHDYASITDYAMYEEHHVHGARLAGEALAVLGYPDEKIRQVQQCILCHRGSVPADRTTVEAVCLADADAMAHFASIPSLYMLAFKSHGMDVDTANRWIASKLRRSWEKLSESGKEIVAGRYRAFLEMVGEPDAALPDSDRSQNIKKV